MGIRQSDGRPMLFLENGSDGECSRKMHDVGLASVGLGGS